MSASPVAARVRIALVTAAILGAMAPAPASASIARSPITDGSVTPALTSSSIRLNLIASGLHDPVLITSARDGTGRTFIVEKGGRILVRKNGAILATPLLDISASVSKGSEQGLLGLAFHPSFRTNRKFYVNYTNTSGDTVIREYRTSSTNPDRVASGSGRTILRIDQPYANHNGGMLAFGPGGYLYIGMGDGGDANDPGNRAQSLSTLLGKMLRIDINGTTSTRAYRIPSSNPYVGRTGRDEIWQRGLRNPWRFSFDRANGTLWIGDVGQNSYEEVDRATNTSSGPGKAFNWGWRVMEGRHCHIPSTGCNTSGKKLPVYEYTHASNGRCAVTGGYVYRGTKVAALVGWYVFGDYCSGEIFAIRANASWPPTRVTLAGASSGRLISSFGESAGGELYVVDLRGNIYGIAAA
ncbi:MAG TPA: PQQ-dependent sugar dehydrogenase [Candidatus Limnocylindrales bacterium]